VNKCPLLELFVDIVYNFKQKAPVDMTQDIIYDTRLTNDLKYAMSKNALFFVFTVVCNRKQTCKYQRVHDFSTALLLKSN